MKIIKRIGLLVLFSITGAILMYLYSSASLRGSFVQWESLGKPPSKPVKIVASGYVQTESGDTYQYSNNSSCGNNCWQISDNPLSNPEYPPPKNDCGDVPPFPLDNYVDSMTMCEHWGTGRSLTIYAVDLNGFVYYWNHKLGEGDYLVHLLSPYVGAIIGMLIGLFVLVVTLFLDFIKRLQRKP